jgi:small subunit ribosomal protein S21
MRTSDREPIGAALRRFKKLVERSGMKEVRAHEHYEKPSEARRRKEARRRSAIRKAALKPRA